jgi:secreted trypsin-like serine protease
MPLLRTLLATLAAGLAVASPAQAIVGGHDASPGEYPYVAHILIDRSFQCTGTLVTPTHVVTAAHCSSLVPGGVDTCQGDSGGLLLVAAGSELRLVGDTSYGNGCAEPGFPGVYGRVADDTLREWIRSVAPGAIAYGSGSSSAAVARTTADSSTGTRSYR